MAGAFDINGFNYGYGTNGVGVAMPSVSAVGASQPLAIAGQAQAAAPVGAVSGGLGQLGQTGLGFNLPTANLALGGLQTIGNLWNSWEQRKLANEQFQFQKGVTNTNLNNQIKAYNTQLEDRSRARAATEGQSPGQAQAYIDNNRLSR
jgi:hypothetical protein